MTTTVTLSLPANPEAARQAGYQAARILRKPARPERQAEPRPQVPYEHHVLFREAVYTDGQSYAALDDEDDDTDG